ncbi:hypothetical protein N2152v2_004652 [Parachlorella kessleri]
MDRGPPRRGGGGTSFLAQKIDEKNRLKESISTHRTGLPDKLLKLFAARPPLEYLPPPRKKPPKQGYTGIGQYVEGFAAPGEEEYEPPAPETRPPEPRIMRNPELATQARVDFETKPEKQVRLAKERQQQAQQQVEENVKSWDPAKDPNVEGDPFKTLFVGRLSFDVTERKLRRELEEYGAIKSVRIVHDKNSGKPRGYAFVEFEHKADMKNAYKMADGRKIENRRVLVDVERGRTVPNWRPRRLGGGKGGEAREPKPPKDPKAQFVNKLIERAMAEQEREARKVADRERERGERDRERDRERRERENGREADGADKRGERDRERERSGRDRERERAARPDPGRDKDPREKEPRAERERERGDRERERDRDRKRERDDRGYDSSHKRAREERPRERDL